MLKVLDQEWESVVDEGTATTARVTPSSTDGRLLFVMIYRDTSTTDPSTVPSGFTQVGKYTIPGGSRTLWLYVKVRQYPDPSYWDFIWAASDRTIHIASAYSGGFAWSDPIEDSSSADYTTSDTTLRGGSVTTLNKMTTLLFFGFVKTSSDPTPVTAPAGTGQTWYVDYETYDATGDFLFYTARCWWYGGNGASGNKDATLSLARTLKHAFMVAVRQDLNMPLLMGCGL